MIAADHWVRQINGKLTFCGVLEEYYIVISRRWEQSTREKYNRDYDIRILPALNAHDSKTMDMYTKEDFDDAIEQIIETRTAAAGSPNAYADSTIQHFRHLIALVVITAADNGLCENVLWGTVFTLPESQDRRKADVQERIKYKKSLTVTQEYSVADALLTNVQQRGEEMGLLLMFALGLRNGEACGADYGDIKPMAYHPDCHTLWVYKSTVAGTSKLQASGKTKNADRIIPIPSVLYSFLMKRRCYLKQCVDFSAAPNGISCVDNLPIACTGNHFFTRCSAAKLTAAGRELFRKIKMEQRQLAYIDVSLSSADNASFERDPTAYLFRRNFGTHLHILGLTEAEIQYVIGHDIEDLYETRNEFVNEEKLYEIKLKLDQRPILNDVSNPIHALDFDHPSLIIDSSAPTPNVSIPANCSHINIHLTANEPGDAITIRRLFSRHPQSVDATEQAFIGPIKRDYPRTVNTLSTYHTLYSGNRH